MARMRTFRAMRGITVEHRGIWKKFECAVEIELEGGDDYEGVKEKAWRTVEAELVKQLDAAADD